MVSDIRCVNLQLKGKLKGDVVGLRNVEVAGDAELKGDVTAASLNVAPGAMLEGFYRIGPKVADEAKAQAKAEDAVDEAVKEEAVVKEEQAAPVVIKVPVRKSVVPIRRH